MNESQVYSKNQSNFYQLIASNFLACCSKNAKRKKTTINLQVWEESSYNQSLVIVEQNILQIILMITEQNNLVHNIKK
ncbi:unnamed protein product [Paramecium sonneborni]|uniref:Uncharacterized protein n=1 Tax=Paramecium sonneborni TaxID=65129 RepID=A0A8S1P694_9CILI|nr:unnamed protein product [Paramecium sonneborni]